MISQMEMDLLEVQAVNMLIEINLEFKALDEEGREDDGLRRNSRLLQRPGEADSVIPGGGESVGGGEGEVYSGGAGG